MEQNQPKESNKDLDLVNPVMNLTAPKTIKLDFQKYETPNKEEHDHGIVDNFGNNFCEKPD